MMDYRRQQWYIVGRIENIVAEIEDIVDEVGTSQIPRPNSVSRSQVVRIESYPQVQQKIVQKQS